MQERNLEDATIRKILTATKIIITQDYISFKGNPYLQKNGLEMCVPTSSILSEIDLQHLENIKIYDILKNSRVVGYFRNVDDVLLIDNETLTDIADVISSFNDLTPSLNFTLERQIENKLNYLDVSLIETTENYPSIYI